MKKIFPRKVAKIYATLKAVTHRQVRRLFEALGSDRYSRPALNNLDAKLAGYFAYKNGFFIEVGANDGYAQSNTYYLERFLAWQGILVEGIPELYTQCRKERQNSTVFNCALVPAGYPEPFIDMTYSNLMSLVKGAQKSVKEEMEHVRRGNEIQKVESYEIRVPARTLTSILDECNVKEIDFLSIDVEGYELNVLMGLDMHKYKPKYMLIEARYRDDINNHVSDLYNVVAELSHHDILYKRKGQ